MQSMYGVSEKVDRKFTIRVNKRKQQVKKEASYMDLYPKILGGKTTRVRRFPDNLFFVFVIRIHRDNF